MNRLVIAASAALTLLGVTVTGSSANTLRFASAGDIYGLDPDSMTDSFSNAFLNHIYEGLVRYNDKLKIEPALALSWKTIKPDVVRYTLRQGVKFHDGAEFSADDVVMSLERAADEHSPIKGNLPGLKSVEKVDDYTVDVHLAGPTPLLNNYLTNILIMDSGWLQEHDAVKPVDATVGEEGYATSHANGTGPFMLESRRPDAETVLKVNKNWWDKPRHNLDEIVLTPIASDATRVAALLSGQVDLIVPSPLQDAGRISHSSDAKVLQAPGLRTIMMGFNYGDNLNVAGVEGNPLKDVRVRKAIAQAVDMDLIRDKIMRGASRNAGTLVAPEVPGFDAKLNDRLPYDPAAAKKLLADAGYPDGFAFEMNCPNDSYVKDAEICQAMAAMLAKVGLSPKLTTESKTIHFKKARQGKTDMFMLGWATLPMLDGFSVISALLHSPEGEYGTWNPGNYKNAKIDELTKKIDVELDEAKRRAMMGEAFAVAKDDIAWLPLHQQPLSWAVRNNVHVVQTADDLVRLWYARMD